MKHLHQQIGDAIRAEKVALFKRLEAGDDVAVAIAEFITDLSDKLKEVVKNLNSPNVAD